MRLQAVAVLLVSISVGRVSFDLTQELGREIGAVEVPRGEKDSEKSPHPKTCGEGCFLKQPKQGLLRSPAQGPRSRAQGKGSKPCVLRLVPHAFFFCAPCLMNPAQFFGNEKNIANPYASLKSEVPKV